MSARGLVIFGGMAGLGYLAYKMMFPNSGGSNDAGSLGDAITAPVDLGFVTDFGNVGADNLDSSSYLSSLAQAESGSRLYAKNPYSSASGLYQFTKATWIGLGGQWGDDPSQAFGGLTPSKAEQDAMAQKLTAQNASILSRFGVAINNATLYAAHAFGATKAAKILAADPSTPLNKFVSSSTLAINPIFGQTVGSFWNYLTRKVG